MFNESFFTLENGRKRPKMVRMIFGAYFKFWKLEEKDPRHSDIYSGSSLL